MLPNRREDGEARRQPGASSPEVPNRCYRDVFCLKSRRVPWRSCKHGNDMSICIIHMEREIYYKELIHTVMELP